jgi:hypothetical protein
MFSSKSVAKLEDLAVFFSYNENIYPVVIKSEKPSDFYIEYRK